jgi:hypothetical protein
MKLARIHRDAEDAKKILQNNTDLSAKQYITEQQPSLQRTMETLQALQCGTPEPAATSAGTKTTDSTLDSPARPIPISNYQPCPSPAMKVPDPSAQELLKSLEARMYQERIRNSITWDFAERKNMFVHV